MAGSGSLRNAMRRPSVRSCIMAAARRRPGKNGARKDNFHLYSSLLCQSMLRGHAVCCAECCRASSCSKQRCCSAEKLVRQDRLLMCCVILVTIKSKCCRATNDKYGCGSKCNVRSGSSPVRQTIPTSHSDSDPRSKS